MPLPLLRTRNAQLQIGESIMVIIIITILAVFLFNFYFRLATNDLQQQIGEIDELNVLETAQIASNLYELTCSKAGVTDVCFDAHKTIAFAELRTEQPELVQDYYQELFGNSKISLITVYPEEHEYVLYWNNATNGSQTSIPVVIPVAIHNGSSDTNTFGIFRIEQYQRAGGSV